MSNKLLILLFLCCPLFAAPEQVTPHVTVLTADGVGQLFRDGDHFELHLGGRIYPVRGSLAIALQKMHSHPDWVKWEILFRHVGYKETSRSYRYHAKLIDGEVRDITVDLRVDFWLFSKHGSETIWKTVSLKELLTPVPDLDAWVGELIDVLPGIRITPTLGLFESDLDLLEILGEGMLVQIDDPIFDNHDRHPITQYRAVPIVRLFEKWEDREDVVFWATRAELEKFLKKPAEPLLIYSSPKAAMSRNASEDDKVGNATFVKAGSLVVSEFALHESGLPEGGFRPRLTIASVEGETELSRLRDILQQVQKAFRARPPAPVSLPYVSTRPTWGQKMRERVANCADRVVYWLLSWWP